MATNLAVDNAPVAQTNRQATRGKNTIGDWVIGIILSIIVLLVLFPFYDVVIISFGTPTGAILPRHFTLDAYKFILDNVGFWRAFLTSLGIVGVGTFVSLLLTTVTAYALSRKHLPGRGIVMGMILFTMFFGGGLIPYYLVVKNLGLINSYWSMIIPSAMNAFYMIVMLTFFRDFPDSLDEAARIDGANDWVILTRIVLPTSGPVMATISLFYAVDRWNDWFTPMLFLTDPNKWPLQTYTQQMLTDVSILLQNMNGAAGASSVLTSQIGVLSDPLKMAVIIVGMLPIMMVYPFLQKYFAKGVMIGSIKG